MSGIQLTNELVTELKTIVEKHDPTASEDLMFTQYLSAVTGFVVAHQTHPGLDQKDFLNELANFSQQVRDQVAKDLNPPVPEDAFGIWKPDQE